MVDLPGSAPGSSPRYLSKVNNSNIYLAKRCQKVKQKRLVILGLLDFYKGVELDHPDGLVLDHL